MSAKWKKIMSIVLSVGIVAAISIGGTLTYLTHMTESKANTFTVSLASLKAALYEPNWVEADASKMLPGQTVPKKSYIENISTGANACDERVAARVTFRYRTGEHAGELLSAVDLSKVMDTFTLTFPSMYWLRIVGTESDGTQVFMYTQTIAPGEKTEDLTSELTCKSTADNAAIAAVRDIGGFTIQIDGYAIQKDAFTRTGNFYRYIKNNYNTIWNGVNNSKDDAVTEMSIIGLYNKSSNVSIPIGDTTFSNGAIKVYAMMSDGSKNELDASQYTISGTVDTGTAGTYTLTVAETATGMSTTVTVNVYQLFYWTVDNTAYTDASGNTYDGTASIYQYTGSDTTVTFPSSVFGIRNNSGFTANGKTYAVTSIIKKSANYVVDRDKTVGIVLPQTLTTIGDSAFIYCEKLTGTLAIPSGVTTIGNQAFSNCSFSGSLVIPSNVTSIGNGAFYCCKGLTGALTIPDSVTTIGRFTFADCSGFTGTLTIGNSVTTIGDDAFVGCSGLTGALTIPASVTSIGSCAFESCADFTGALTIPDSVTTIGSRAFSGCSGITSASFPSWVSTDSNKFYGLSSSICTVR